MPPRNDIPALYQGEPLPTCGRLQPAEVTGLIETRRILFVINRAAVERAYQEMSCSGCIL